MLAIKARRVEGKDAVIGDLAETLMLTHHSCVGLVNRLELRGLVHRSRDAVDGRRVHVELTPIGEDAVESLAKAHQAQLQHLGPELIASLAKVVDVVQHGEPFGE
jgi:DNA-binding MarR family transcriptional regulator